MGALTSDVVSTSTRPSTRLLVRVRRRFVGVTTVVAGLSLIPAIAAPDDTATKVVLVGIHLLAAAIIIPALNQRLTSVD